MRSVYRHASSGLLSLILWGNSSGLVQAKSTAVPYVINTSHSRVSFEIAHLVISTVEGSFKTFSGTFDYDVATNTLGKSEIVIQVDSIDTNEPKRDAHLKGADFFNTAKFPTMSFTSTSLEVKDGKPAMLHGMLQMHGVSKPVDLRVDFKGYVQDPGGPNKIMAFHLEGTLNRKDFGLVYNKVLEAGGIAIGEEVTIKIRVEAAPKEAPKK